MANNIQLKRSSVQGKVPDAANVLVGEPVINLSDGVIYTKDVSGNVIQIGSGTLQSLQDVSNTSPNTNQVLTWSGSIWQPSDVQVSGGGVSSVGGVTGAVSNAALLASLIAVDGTGSGLDADLLDGRQASTFVYSDGTDNGSTTIKVNDADFIVQDTTDGTTNYIWRDHSANVLYLGAAASAVVTPRSSVIPNASSTYDLGSTGARWSNVYVNNITITNDGSGSGIDADLLDGQQGSYYSPLATTQAAYGQANTAVTIGQAAFASGNTKVATVAGVTSTTISNVQLAAGIASANIANLSISGDVNIGGNLYITGNTTTFSSNNLVISDPLIYLGEGNTGDVLDLGFVSSFNDGTYQHAGLARDASDGKWKLFANVVPEPGTTIDFTNATYSTLKLGSVESVTGTFTGNVTTGNVSGTTGTFTNLSSTNTITGYVSGAKFSNDSESKDDITTRTESGFWQTGSGTTAEGWPLNDNSWQHMLAVTHANDSNYFSMQFGGSFYDQNFYGRKTNNSGTQSWSKFWTDTNDGAGSGLDADLLDGLQESTFMRRTATSELAMSNYNITGVNNIIINDPGPGEGIEWSGGNAWKIYESPNDLTTNSGGNLQIAQGATRRATFNTSGQLEIPVATGTSPLSVSSTTIVTNLNADLLDGVDSASFLRSDADDSFTGTITNNGVFEALLEGSTPTTTPKLKFGRSASQFMTFHGNSSGNYITAVSSSGNPKPTMYLGVSTDSGNTLSSTYTLSGTSGGIWHSGNDGTGSGLDADLWDGNQFASYLNQAVLTSSSPTFAAATISGNVTVDTDTLFVNSTSNLVGIGTASPTYKLHTVGSTNGLFASGSATTNVSLTWGASASHILRAENSELAFGLEDTSPYGYYLQARTNGNTAREILLNPLGGNVGIGTQSPAVNLSVAGTIGVGESGSTGGRFRITSTGSGAELFQNDNSDIIFKTATATQEKMRIKDSGNVGIGTTTPSYKLHVNGSFAATTKSFVIDHPTKPGMKLRYGSLEGPENGVYVRGKLKGTNVIELPDYWTKLVDPDSITVQLTSIGKHQKLYVEDIKDNKIFVSNEESLSEEINCFYLVHAERIDVEKFEIEF